MSHAHPINRFLPYVGITAHQFGASLLPQDREEMEAYMRLRLWETWEDGAGRNYAIACLRYAAQEWIRSEKPGRLTRTAHRTYTDTPPGSPGWEAVPYHRRQAILGMLAVRRPASLQDLLTDEEDDGSPFRGEGGRAVTDPRPTPEEECLARAGGAEVRALLAVLTPRERQVIWLLYGEGVPRHDAAHALGITLGCLNIYRDRAMAKLRTAAGVDRREATGARARFLAAVEAMGIDLTDARPLDRGLRIRLREAVGCSVGRLATLLAEERAIRRACGARQALGARSEP
jgi:RNA polymerase sigma factor (sigma-70 family)